MENKANEDVYWQQLLQQKRQLKLQRFCVNACKALELVCNAANDVNDDNKNVNDVRNDDAASC